ncbi:Mitochondrial carnitine/acylcarnitine carrier-like protein, partial [Mucuna pruriens]
MVDRKRIILFGYCLKDNFSDINVVPTKEKMTKWVKNVWACAKKAAENTCEKSISHDGKCGKGPNSWDCWRGSKLIIGQPFETIKIKLQSQPKPLPGQFPKYSGAIDAVKQTVAAEGTRGLYKGMGAPLATVAAFNAVLFTVRGQMEPLLSSHPGATLTVNQQAVCGARAGVAVSFLASPTQLIKCSSE